MQFRLISVYNGLICIEAGITASVAFGLRLLERVLVLVSDNFRHSTRDFHHMILISLYPLSVISLPSVGTPVSAW
jgi:hypothetical protein